MTKNLPLDKLMNGYFYQVHLNEGERIAQRAFSLYDKDASSTLSNREVEQMIKSIYLTLDPSKKVTEEEVKKYLEILDTSKSGKVKNKDFEQLNKKGALDYQTFNREEFEYFDMKTKKLKKPIEDLIKQMHNLAQSRFGKDFVANQKESCQYLWEKYNPQKKASIDYKMIQGVFEDLYRKINLDVEVKEEDFQSIFESIDVVRNGAIDYQEFELWYFRGLLSTQLIIQCKSGCKIIIIFFIMFSNQISNLLKIIVKKINSFYKLLKGVRI